MKTSARSDAFLDPLFGNEIGVSGIGQMMQGSLERLDSTEIGVRFTLSALALKIPAKVNK